MKNCFVIVNYNDYSSTINLINNIKDYKLVDEIVIIDNKSVDDSLSLLKKLKMDKLNIIENDKNGGYSYALNKGCKYLINKYGECNIFISNSDIIVSDESDLVELIKNINEEVVIAAPAINTNGVISRGWKIPKIGREILFNIPLVQKVIIKFNGYKNSHYKDIVSKVYTVSGCFFLISSNFVEEMKYFDDEVFLYYEENIFGMKAKQLNKTIVTVNDIQVIHNHSVTIDKSINKMNKLRIQKKSQQYFCENYLKTSRLSLRVLRITASINLFLMKIWYFFI